MINDLIAMDINKEILSFIDNYVIIYILSQ